MKVLIAYGTTEGQTRKIVKTIAQQINARGHEVELLDTSARQIGLHPESFDKIIVAGSVHDQRHQEGVEIFALANITKLQSKPTMFLSVSLAAAFEEGLADAQGYVDSFIEKFGWHPEKTMLVAGAMRHGRFGYYKDQILEHVVLKNRILEDPKGDHEFTDWNFLAKAVDEFIGV